MDFTALELVESSETGHLRSTTKVCAWHLIKIVKVNNSPELGLIFYSWTKHGVANTDIFEKNLLCNKKLPTVSEENLILFRKAEEKSLYMQQIAMKLMHCMQSTC